MHVNHFEASALDIPASNGLRLRQAYADAAGQGTVVWRLGPRTQAAADEMQSLLEELYGSIVPQIDEPSVANG